MAPESYLDAVWDLKSDVWMFGVLLWGLIVRDAYSKFNLIDRNFLFLGNAMGWNP